MSPDQPNQAPNTPPQQQPYAAPQPSAMPQQPYMSAQPAATPKSGIKLPIILMVWPAATLVLIFVLAIITSLLSSDAPGSLFGSNSILKMIINLFIFLCGAIAVLGGPVSFIVGLVLLVVRKSKV